MPNFGSRVETIQWQEPNRARAATTRSPVFRCESSAALTAAMPVAVVRQSSAPSIRAEALFEHGEGRVGKTGILVVFDGAGEGGFGLFGVVVDVAGSEEQRFGGFAVMGALDAAMNQAGGGTQADSALA